MTPTGYDHPTSSRGTGFTLTPQCERMTHVSSAFASAYSSAPVPAALDACFIRATSVNHEHHSACPWAPKPKLTVPNVAGEATGTEGCRHWESCLTMHSSASLPTRTRYRPPTTPQPTSSTLVTEITQNTPSSSSLLTRMPSKSIGPGSLVPVPTTSSKVSPNGSSASSRCVPLHFTARELLWTSDHQPTTFDSQPSVGSAGHCCAGYDCHQVSYTQTLQNHIVNRAFQRFRNFAGTKRLDDRRNLTGNYSHTRSTDNILPSIADIHPRTSNYIYLTCRRVLPNQ